MQVLYKLLFIFQHKLLKVIYCGGLVVSSNRTDFAFCQKSGFVCRADFLKKTSKFYNNIHVCINTVPRSSFSRNLICDL
jgi:hypothetical protein